MKIALYYHGLPPQTHNSSPIMRKMSAKSQCVCVWGGIQQNTTSPPQNCQDHQKQATSGNQHSQEEPREM